MNKNKINHYLDIDGTILTKNHKQADGLKSFLTYLYMRGNVYWLSTHSKDGENKHLYWYLKQHLDEECFELAYHFKISKWITMKTEAIDFSKPFIWFDDYLLEAEKDVLKRNNCFDSWIEINLQKHDNNIVDALENKL